MKTHKVCKGTGKAIGHGCGKTIPVVMFGKANRAYGIGKSCGCYSNWLLNSEEGKALLDRTTLKVTAPARSLKAYENGIKEKRSLSKEIQKTQVIFNRYVRIRDRGKLCISEGVIWSSDFDAGHYFSANKYSGLRFNEDNVHGQSIQGNRFRNGNFEDYSINLPKRIGVDRFKELKKLAVHYNSNHKHWTIDELIIIQEKYSKKTKELEN